MKALIPILLLLHSSVANATYSDKELNCLAHVVYHESRGESAEGQVAVANVVMNRAKSQEFPTTLCGVAYQAHQFTNIKLTKPDKTSLAWFTAKQVAVLTASGIEGDPTHGAMFFYAQAKVKPKWARHSRATVIGHHTFL